MIDKKYCFRTLNLSTSLKGLKILNTDKYSLRYGTTVKCHSTSTMQWLHDRLCIEIVELDLGVLSTIVDLDAMEDTEDLPVTLFEFEV